MIWRRRFSPITRSMAGARALGASLDQPSAEVFRLRPRRRHHDRSNQGVRSRSAEGEGGEREYQSRTRSPQADVQPCGRGRQTQPQPLYPYARRGQRSARLCGSRRVRFPQSQLAEYLQDPIAFLYFSGWRLGEMKSLEWRDVDLAGKVVISDPRSARTRTDGSYRFRVSCSKSWIEHMRSAGRTVPSYSIAMANRSEIFAKPGRRRARRRGSIRYLFMIFVGPLCVTWCAQEFRSCCDDAVRAQDAEHLRPIQHRERS